MRSSEVLSYAVRGFVENVPGPWHKPEKLSSAGLLEKEIKRIVRHPHDYPPGGHLIIMAVRDDPVFTLYTKGGEEEHGITEDEAYAVLDIIFGRDANNYGLDKRVNLGDGMVLDTALHPLANPKMVSVERYRFDSNHDRDMLTISLKGRTHYDDEILASAVHFPNEKNKILAEPFTLHLRSMAGITR